jgi:putative MATE family efflux protein
MEIYDNSAKGIFKMSVPIFFELLLQLMVGNIDQIMVSRVSQNSVAAIGNGNQVMNIIIIVLNAMSVATTILISKSMGAGEKNKSKVVASVSVGVMLFFSVIVTAALALWRVSLFSWLNVPKEIMHETSSFTMVVGSFIVVQAMYMVVAAILRSYNKNKEIMLVAIIMNLVNIVGNAILINGLFGMPKMGIMGAAVSTDFSKALGLGLIIFTLIKKTNMSLDFFLMKSLSGKTLKQLLLISLPSGGEAMSYNLSQICIQRFINLFGTIVINTKVYCYILANIAYVYSIAIAQATQVVTGYLMGKADYDSIKKRVFSSAVISICVSVTLTTLMYFNSDLVFRMFTDNPEILALGKSILLVEIFLEIGRSVNITMVKCLVATGDVNFPMIVSVFSVWTVAVGGGYILGILFNMGLVGIWIAMACDEFLRAVVFVIRFKMGKWKIVKTNNQG